MEARLLSWVCRVAAVVFAIRSLLFGRWRTGRVKPVGGALAAKPVIVAVSIRTFPADYRRCQCLRQGFHHAALRSGSGAGMELPTVGNLGGIRAALSTVCAGCPLLAFAPLTRSPAPFRKSWLRWRIVCFFTPVSRDRQSHVPGRAASVWSLVQARMIASRSALLIIPPRHCQPSGRHGVGQR